MTTLATHAAWAITRRRGAKARSAGRPCHQPAAGMSLPRRSAGPPLGSNRGLKTGRVHRRTRSRTPPRHGRTRSHRRAARAERSRLHRPRPGRARTEASGEFAGARTRARGAADRLASLPVPSVGSTLCAATHAPGHFPQSASPVDPAQWPSHCIVRGEFNEGAVARQDLVGSRFYRIPRVTNRSGTSSRWVYSSLDY
jgi:hypothetical protein